MPNDTFFVSHIGDEHYRPCLEKTETDEGTEIIKFPEKADFINLLRNSFVIDICEDSVMEFIREVYHTFLFDQKKARKALLSRFFTDYSSDDNEIPEILLELFCDLFDCENEKDSLDASEFLFPPCIYPFVLFTLYVRRKEYRDGVVRDSILDDAKRFNKLDSKHWTVEGIRTVFSEYRKYLLFLEHIDHHMPNCRSIINVSQCLYLFNYYYGFADSILYAKYIYRDTNQRYSWWLDEGEILFDAKEMWRHSILPSCDFLSAKTDILLNDIDFHQKLQEDLMNNTADQDTFILRYGNLLSELDHRFFFRC